MKSKFSLWAFFPIIVGVPLLFLIVSFFTLKSEHDNSTLGEQRWPLMIILGSTWIWLFWGEFRTKMIKVSIDGDTISVRKFGGLSRKKEYLISEFDGFTISKQFYGARGILEYLYLMQGKRKVVKISEAYHKNYKELKAAIKLKAKDLGHENFSFMDELKEIFI
jgi:hypothetical protein